MFCSMYDMLQHMYLCISTLKYTSNCNITCIKLYDILTEAVSFLFNCDTFMNHSCYQHENVNPVCVRPGA